MSFFNPFSGGGGFSLPGFGGGGGIPGLPQIPGLPNFLGGGGQPQQPNYGGGPSGPYQPLDATSTGSDFHGLLAMLMNQNRQGGGGGQSYLGGQGLI